MQREDLCFAGHQPHGEGQVKIQTSELVLCVNCMCATINRSRIQGKSRQRITDSLCNLKLILSILQCLKPRKTLSQSRHSVVWFQSSSDGFTCNIMQPCWKELSQPLVKPCSSCGLSVATGQLCVFCAGDLQESDPSELVDAKPLRLDSIPETEANLAK